MTWAKLDDQFPIHRKVGALSDASFRLHVEAICWCVRNLTDGAVSRDDLPQVTRIKKAERYAAELVRRGVWRETASGWEIHDFLDYQPSKNQVQRDRSVAADRQRRWRDQHKQNGHGVSHAVTDTVTNAAPSRPVPSSSSSPPHTAIAAALELDKEDEDVKKILELIKTEHQPRTLGPYIQHLAANGDLTAIHDRVRNNQQTTRPPGHPFNPDDMGICQHPRGRTICAESENHSIHRTGRAT